MRTLIAKTDDSTQKTDDGKAIVAQMLDLIQNSLDDDKAEDIVTIDLAGKTSMADYMIVASGRSSRQVGAITQKLIERLKHADFGTPKVDGTQTGDWVVVDTGDVIVHIFRPEVRDFYKIEKLWAVTPSDDMSSDDMLDDLDEFDD